MRTMSLLGCASLLAAAIIGGCAPEGEEETIEQTEEALKSAGCASAAPEQRAWCLERSKRQAAVDKYVDEHDDEAREFISGAFANAGMPLILFKLLPELFPEIWGPASSQMAVLGMGPNPYEYKADVPLGFAVAQQKVLGDIKISVATLSCSYCHVGRVKGDDGKIIHLLGAPSSQNVNILGFHAASALSPKFTAANLRAKLVTKPLGWLFPGDPFKIPREIKERTLFLLPGTAEKIVEEYKKMILGGAGAYQATFGKYTYGVPNAPNPNALRRGSMDAVNAAIIIRMDPANLPTAADISPAPAEVDMMGVWRQVDRPNSHWDGGFVHKLFRNAGSALGTTQNPADFRRENAYATTNFVEHLPAPPYPFDVDMKQAKRGKVLYDKYCASCHAPGNNSTFKPAVTGTDPNRVDLLRSYGIKSLIATARAGLCWEPGDCKNPDGTDWRDEQLIAPTGGYVAVPLTGVWSTAPYLHNGSVPTLRALMTGDRPAKFYRGNIDYDKKNVGFVYDVPTEATTELDTNLAGFSNKGHTGSVFLGDVDWKTETQKLDDLLEYMKTL